MLGINTPYHKYPKSYRNHAYASKNDSHFLELKKLKLIEYSYPGPNDNEIYYTCTPLGKKLAMESHKTIRKSKAKRRYRIYLDIKDLDPELTFRKYLTEHCYKKYRDDA